ncbi:MAG TPA: phosphate acyltransferase, partial [Alphaproteobacteria bacterium]|nr:phosphate acyltransferase [Alphaproteobacteria bacterium]
EPRLAFVAYSTFGYPMGERSRHVRDAVRLLDERGADFEYDGEMAVNVALNPAAQRAYPFMRLKGPANVLIMPAIHSASISTRIIQELGGATVIGPILIGLEKPVQIASFGASSSDIAMMAAIAAFNPTDGAVVGGATQAKRFDI